MAPFILQHLLILVLEMSFAEREFNSTLSAVRGLQQNDGMLHPPNNASPLIYTSYLNSKSSYITILFINNSDFKASMDWVLHKGYK